MSASHTPTLWWYYHPVTGKSYAAIREPYDRTPDSWWVFEWSTRQRQKVQCLGIVSETEFRERAVRL